MILLEIENATVRFGGIVAIDNVSLRVNEGESLPCRPKRGWEIHGLQPDLAVL